MVFERFREVVRGSAEAYRVGMSAQGSEGLIALIDSLPSIVQSSNEAETLNTVLTAILEAQARKDHLYLADLLDYELLGLLSRSH